MAFGFSVSLPLYVRRRGEMLHFRMKVPECIRNTLDMCEVSFSLKTNTPREAGRKAQRLAWITRRIFEDIREGEYHDMDREEIKRLVREWLEKALDDDERIRASRKRPRSLQEVEDEEETYSTLASDYRERLAADDYRGRIETAEELLREQGITLDREDDAFKALCRELTKATVTLLDTLQKRNRGEGPEEYATPAGSGQVQAVIPSGSSSDLGGSEEAGPLLSEVLSAFVRDKRQLGEWTAHTEKDNVPMIRDFIEMVGDMPINHLKAEHMRDARDRFMRIPKNIQQTKKYSGKSLRELSDMDIPESRRLSKQTLNNRAVKVGGFLNWARERRV